jgi:hypothetical protein
MKWLINAQWLTVNTVNRKDSQSWLVNPLVHERFAEWAIHEAKQREGVKALVAKGRRNLADAYA